MDRFQLSRASLQRVLLTDKQSTDIARLEKTLDAITDKTFENANTCRFVDGTSYNNVYTMKTAVTLQIENIKRNMQPETINLRIENIKTYLTCVQQKLTKQKLKDEVDDDIDELRDSVSRGLLSFKKKVNPEKIPGYELLKGHITTDVYNLPEKLPKNTVVLKYVVSQIIPKLSETGIASYREKFKKYLYEDFVK
jgi:hypothetical protein